MSDDKACLAIAVEGLRQIANGESVTKQVSDPEDAFINGKREKVVYVEFLSPPAIARQTLARLGGAGEA